MNGSPLGSGGGHFTQMSTYSQPFNPSGNIQQQPQKLNQRFNSNPELSLNDSYDDGNGQQNIIDMIENDIFNRLIQKVKTTDTETQNQLFYQELENNLKTMNSIDPGFSQQMNIDLNNLGQMNRNTLNQLYNNLSVLLGKGTNHEPNSHLLEPDNFENKKSQVLYVKGLENPNIRVQMLYNIFSNFGNILKIIFIRSKGVALLEFESAECSTVSKDYLNNIVFMGKPLRVNLEYFFNR